MNRCHITKTTIAHWRSGEEFPSLVREVVRHMLARCPRCLAQAAEALSPEEDTCLFASSYDGMPESAWRLEPGKTLRT
jgi:hypothetical protein